MTNTASDSVLIETGGRSFRVEPDTDGPGWLLREFYRGGWPVDHQDHAPALNAGPESPANRPASEVIHGTARASRIRSWWNRTVVRGPVRSGGRWPGRWCPEGCRIAAG